MIAERLLPELRLVEGRSDPLRFASPAPDPMILPRPRLTNALAVGLDRRLTLLKAPPGFGKSTLLSALAAGWADLSPGSNRRLLAWYRLEPRDGDAAIFTEGVVAAVRRVLPGFGRTTESVLRDALDARAEFPRLMALFQDDLRDYSGSGVTIVLEGLHNLRDRAMLDVLEHALREPSSPLRLIVSTQTDPGFYLSVLRSGDGLTEVGEEDLRFTAREIAELAQRRVGRPLPPQAVEEMARQTAGWPSAVWLAAAIVAREGGTVPFRRLAPTLHGYGRLLGELLAPLPADARDSVLRAALLRHLEPRALREAVGVRAPERLLRVIEETGLPVVRPANGEQMLEYEPLLRSILEQQLAQRMAAGEYAALRQRVAAYYADEGDPDEAIRRYIRAGNPGAAATVAEEAIEGELDRGHLDLVRAWLRSIPNSTRRQHPRLMVQEARLLLAGERLSDARVLLVPAGPVLQQQGDRRGQALLNAGWARFRLLEGRHAEALGSAREALRLLSPEDSAERAELHGLVAEAHEALGDLRDAFASASQALLAAEVGGSQPGVVRAMLQMGRLAWLRGDYSHALALTGRATRRSVHVGAGPSTLALAGGMAATIYLERGQGEAAVKVASMARKVGARLRDVAAQAGAGLATAQAMGQSGEAEVSASAMGQALKQVASLPVRSPERLLAFQLQAADLLRKGRRVEGLATAREALRLASAPSNSNVPLMEQCELILAAGNSPGRPTPSALLRLRRLCGSLRGSDSRRWLSAGLLLLAQGYAGLGLRWPAASNLRKALALAQAESYVGLPLGLPLDSGRLLTLAVRHGIAPEVAGTLLGVDLETGRRVLAPWLTHKRVHLRTRAEQAIKGLETGVGLIPKARLEWPGLGRGIEEGRAPDDRSVEAASVEMVALGRFEPLVGGLPVQWPSPDARDLAAYLVVNRDKSIPRERLFRDLWPGCEMDEANVRLHVALYRIREAVGDGYPAVDSGLEARGLYRWSGRPEAIDAERFRDLLRRAAEQGDAECRPLLSNAVLALMEGAVSLYQGEFLEGFAFQWCMPQRVELRESLLRATRVLMDHYMALRQWEPAIRHGLKSLKSDPLQEDVVRGLMVSYAGLGRRDAVLHQYREVKRLLARERGEWPSDETRQLRVRLLGR